MGGTGSPSGSARILARSDGATIAYNKLDGNGRGRAPGVVFVHGLVSDMTGGKAMALERHCRESGRAFVRFDCFGHGLSSGAFTDGTVGRWADDTVAVLDELTEGPQVIVGSSMGGWVMLLAALRRPEKVAGLVGIACAADFTEDIIWDRLDWTTRERLMTSGLIELPNDGGDPYRISRALIEDGRENLLLRGPLDIRCPVRLIHGMEDGDVPWQTSLLLQERLLSGDVELTLIKNGGHRLSDPADLERMIRIVDDLAGSLSSGG